MKNQRGRKPKHPALALQVSWWAFWVYKLWRGKEEELVEVMSKKWRSLAPRPDFLYDALHFGTEPQKRRGQRRFFDYVEAVSSLPGMALAGADLRKPLFRLGDAEAFTLVGITAMLGEIFKSAKCGRLNPKETLTCEVLRKEWVTLKYPLPDTPFEERAEAWAVDSLINARRVLEKGDWVAMVVLCFREALLCSSANYAKQIKERASDFIFDDVDKMFSRMPKFAQRSTVKSFKRALFDTKFALPAETFDDYLAKAKRLPCAVLSKSELRIRRRALAARSRDRFSAYALMKSDQTLWIYGRVDPD